MIKVNGTAPILALFFLCCKPELTITKLYKIRRNFTALSGLMLTNTPENNRVSKEKR
jgi:hypothetical protein